MHNDFKILKYFYDDFILLAKYPFDHIFVIHELVIFMYDDFIHIGIIRIDSIHDDYFARIGIAHNYFACDFAHNNLINDAIKHELNY